VISIRNLTFAYGDKSVFADFSAELGAGITCVTGPSGAGKTTLLRLLAGLETPQGGVLKGVPAPVSFLFQEDRLLPWCTAAENVAAVLPAREKARAKDFLAAVELGGEADRRPSELSGGQCRRIALARALAYPGALLLLDEPFKGLDPALTERMCALLRADGRPAVVVTHDHGAAALLNAAELAIGA